MRLLRELDCHNSIIDRQILRSHCMPHVQTQYDTKSLYPICGRPQFAARSEVRQSIQRKTGGE